MTSLASAFVEARLDTSGFGSDIKRGMSHASVSSSVKDSGRTAGKSYSSAFGSALKIGGLLAGAFAVTKGISFFKDSIAEAQDAAKMSALTAQVIKSTGGAAGVTTKQILALSTAISNKSGIDDEAIQSGANLLLTFKNIHDEAGKGNKIFDQATVAVTDMSVALGQDMKSGAIQLGKALNDPVKGITALSRVGVTFTEQQKAQVKAMVDSGDTMKAQKLILKELTSEFGGAAAAAATPAEKAAVAWGNFKEDVGTALLPVLGKLATWFTETALPAVERFAGFVKSDVLPVLGSMADFVKRNSDLIAPLAVVIGTAAGAIGAIVAVTAAWTKAQALFNLVMAANPVVLIIVGLAALAAGLVIAYKRSETFRNIVNGAFDAVKKVAGPVLSWLSGAVQTTVGFVKDHWKLLVAIIGGPMVAIGVLIATHWDQIKTGISSAVDAVKTTLSNAWGTIETGASKAWGGIVGAVKTAFNKVKAVVETPIRFVVDTVLNNGLIAGFNKISDIVNGPTIKDITLPFSTGGIYPGYTPGRDIGFAAVSGGEAIMRPEWTRAVGPRNVHAMNKAARAGNLEGVHKYMGGFVSGGVVDPDARVTMDGEPLSKIAAAQIMLAEKLSNLNIGVMQGGWQPYSSYSGSSHEWPGVVDVGPGDFFLQGLMRKVGFAAWGRNFAGAASAGSGAHVHAVSLLDPGNYNGPGGLGVQSQMADFRAGGDGLGGSDYGPNPPMVAGLLDMLKQFGDIASTVPSFAGASASILPGWVTDPIGFLKDKIAGSLDSPILNGDLGKMLKAVPGKLITAMADFVKGLLPSIKAGNLAPGGDAQLNAQSLLPLYGFGPEQFAPLKSLWQKESGWSYTATNPRGGDPATSAYGIPQALPGSKMAMQGADWVTNAQTQIQWGLGYIKERYGSPAAAWAHSVAHNWYDQGGWLPSGGMAFNRSGSPEAVLDPSQSKALMSFAKGGVVPGLAPPGLDPAATAAEVGLWKAAAAAFRHFGVGDGTTAATIRDEARTLTHALAGVFGKDSHIVKAVKATSDALVDVAKDRDQVAAQLDRSQSKLTSLILARQTLETQIAGGFNTTTYGEGAPTTAAGLFMSAHAEINDARHFKRVLQKLKAKGLAPNILKALALAGPAAIVQAEALAGMSRKKLAEYQGLLQTGNQVENSLGAVVGNAIYNDDIKKQRIETHQLNHHLGQLNHRIDKLDEKIEHAVERALRKVHIDLDGKQVNRALADHEHRRNRVGA